MPMLLLLLLTLACLPDDWKQPAIGFDSPERCAAATWLAVALVVGMGALGSGLVRRLCRTEGGRERAVRLYARWRLWHSGTLFGMYALSLYLLGWGWAVQNLCGVSGQLAPGAELLILAPFLASLVCSWYFFYDAERALHDSGPAHDGALPYWSRWGYISFHLRHNLALVLLPILFLIAMKAMRQFVPEMGGPAGGAPGLVDAPLTTRLLHWGIALLGPLTALGILIAMPWVLRLVLGLRPLPDGPLRQRLLAASRRLRFRCSNILLWNTRLGVANAMVAGVLPLVRYVVLTDRLASELSPEEVEAVFGHEVGHVRHRHMLFYLGFMMISLTALWAVVAIFFRDLDGWSLLAARQDLAVLPAVAIVGAYIFLVFGFLSRRCERQADIYGCRAVSCLQADCPGHGPDTLLAPHGKGLCPTGIRTFIDALEKVARLNDISRDRPGWLQSWQHSTIARRVEFLQRMLADPSLEPRFQRSVGLVKWVVLLGLCAAVFLLGEIYGWERVLF